MKTRIKVQQIKCTCVDICYLLSEENKQNGEGEGEETGHFADHNSWFNLTKLEFGIT